ncbi:MAG: 23S rRNA (uracil(1939)-C(5))-methyltransferase RlmD [Clostridia bacterium]|nr:23S rRNA (uracil(1939)-C(5))-methyltransferase RlmD [Clostridia bacterium]
MKKNETYQGKVVSLGSEGEGIIKTDGTTAFVPFCLVGEEVSFKALKVKDSIAYGKLENLNTKSPDRVSPPCPVFTKCGGCDIQHMNYTAQLKFKQDSVSSTLWKIGGVEARVDETIPCDKDYRYRNKLALPIGVNANGETICGFYAPHSHRIVDIPDCLIQAEWIKQVISAVKKFSKENKVQGYNEETRTGILRRIVVRELGGKFIFALVTAKKINCAPLITELEKSFKDFTFLLNINPSQGNAIFSDSWQIVRGAGYFEAEECGIKYRAGAQTFVQVNDDIRAKLYARVLEEADEGAVALDLYSGGGMLTAMLAKKCGTAYGVEIVKEASRLADELKEANGLNGKMFNICGAVENEIENVFKLTEGKKRIIVCDPPRKGMERSVVKAVAQSGADKIVLISCNPATLARDLGLLTGGLEEIGGALYKMCSYNSPYEVTSITPFDMFPQTKWCETLVVLSKKIPTEAKAE